MTLRSPAGRDSRADEARQKIRMVGELMRLSRNVKAQRVREPAENYLQSGFGNPLLPRPGDSSDLLSA
jgi:hypothetical protein